MSLRSCIAVSELLKSCFKSIKRVIIKIQKLFNYFQKIIVYMTIIYCDTCLYLIIYLIIYIIYILYLIIAHFKTDTKIEHFNIISSFKK